MHSPIQSEVTQAVILCGGFGTRMGELTKNTPKPMLEVDETPILVHIIEALKQQGVTEVILCTHYKSSVIEEYFSPLDLGITISISVEPEPLDTAGPLCLIAQKLHDTFFLLCGDEFIDLDMSDLITKHVSIKDAIVTILARPSTHPWDADLIQTNDEGKVTEFVTVHDPKKNYHNLGNGSVYVVSKKVLEYIPTNKKYSFTNDLLPALLKENKTILTRKLKSNEYIKDIGKPERLREAEEFLHHKKLAHYAKDNPKPITTVFLDRDGVLNEEIHLLTMPEQLKILPHVSKAIQLFNKNNIKTIIVTNQPVIARGLCDVITMQEIHKKLEHEIFPGEIDAIYYCPHHPETQYGEGVQALRIDCTCRKPKSGMIFSAVKDHSVDLSAAVMIGDSSRDILAGKNAGIRTILITAKKELSLDEKSADLICTNLFDAANTILNNEGVFGGIQ